MQELSIDIETYSPVDIKRAGAYRYAEEAEVMLFGYSVDFGAPECVDLMTGEEIPEDVVRAMFDPAVRKTAHNAAFERAVLRYHFKGLLVRYANGDWPLPSYAPGTWDLIAGTGGYLPVEQWRCTQVMCARAGYPLSLDEASKAMGLIEKKDPRGAALIRRFSIPCKPTKSNGLRTRNLPEHFPDEWREFIEYCKQDVRTEQAIAKKLDWIPISEQEHIYWHENEHMNERGLLMDMELVEGAMAIDEVQREILLSEATELTGVDNPNSRNQILDWINAVSDVEAETLTKESVKDMLAETEDETTRRVLELRQEIAKSSIRKYSAIQAAVCPDGRVRGTVQFYGAPRTGRAAGRLIQIQNLARISLSEGDLKIARDLGVSGDFDLMSMCFGSVSSTLSQLIRTTIIAGEGSRLLVCDFSAVEARVIAWLAGEDWVLDVFAGHGKIYEATASRMFGVPIEQIGKDSELRQRGKVAVLALGYQGGVNALTTMDIDRKIPDEDKPGLVQMFRKANPSIVRFWYDLENAAKAAMRNPGDVFKVGKKGVAFTVRKNVLLMRLPSGRLLHYPRPHFTPNRFGGESIGFWGMEQQSRKWAKSETYAGKLAENCTQAVARDLLVSGQHQAILKGYSPIANIHDEIICEEKIGFGSVEELASLMCFKKDWMGDIPLRAEGFESKYYKK